MGGGDEVVIDEKHGKCSEKDACDPKKLHVANEPDPCFHDFNLCQKMLGIFCFVLRMQYPNTIAKRHIPIGIGQEQQRNTWKKQGRGAKG